MTHISTNSTINGEDLESSHLRTIEGATSPSPVSAPSENEKNISKRCRNSHSLKTQQYDIARRYTGETYSLRQSVAEPILNQALNVFLSDTVIPAPSGSTSKGHFTNLVALVQSSSRSEALPFALEAVALASLANRFSNSELQLEATRRYTISIHWLRKTNLNSSSDVISVIACILLLSLYEIINANMPSDLNWLQHLQGMIAVMKNLVERDKLPASGIPMIVLGTEPLPKLNKISKSIPGYLNTIVLQPAMPQFSDLCSILPKVQKLFKESATMFEPLSIRYESTLRRHRDEAIALKSELLIWSCAQPDMNRPETIERFTQPYVLRFPGTEDLICPTTHADIYSDYFIACMWNTYRQCQLHLTDLLSRINRSLHKNPEAYNNSRDYAKLCNEIRTFVDTICASVPFMLTGGRIYGNKPRGSIWFQARPPMLIGGLNLQWILFTISILEIVDTNVRRKMKILLLWIGKNLGIRQATVLAHMEKNLAGGITAKGDAVKWTGFLI